MSSSTSVRSPPHPLPYYLINQHADFIASDNNQGDEWQLALSFAVRFLVYVTLIVVIMIVVSVMMKLMKDCDDEAAIGQLATATETNPLIPKEEEEETCTTSLTYGTCDEQDLESGSEDLYDAKICVICYDHSRNCFFVPCGHCATCCGCAQRIIDGEIKNCPICRRLIHKVRKLCK